MTCPRCQIEYNSRHWGECPHCGAVRPPGPPGHLDAVIKTSTIFISTAGGSGIFSSIDEVPEPLRDALVAHTTGSNAATIVIADQGGQARLSAALPTTTVGSQDCGGPSRVLPQQSHARFRGRIPALLWAGLLVAACSGALVWLLISRLP
jgi:hypothetical protein